MRKLFYVLLALTVAFAMTSCGGDDGGGGGTTEKVTITLNSGGATGVAATIEVEKGKSLDSMPAYGTKTGYEFDGWYLENSFTTPLTVGASGKKFDANATIYAKWLELFTVTFYAGASYTGPAIADVSIPNGKSFNDKGLTLPTPVGQGFDGWYPVGAVEEGTTLFPEFTVGTLVTGAITLVAMWGGEFDVDLVTISFEWGAYTTALGANADPDPADIQIVLGFALSTGIQAMPTPPTWFAHRFDKWIEKGAVGTPVAVTLDSTFDDDATLVATWTDWPTVTFNFAVDPASFSDFTPALPTDGSIVIESGAAIGTDDFPADLVSSDEDYMFIGWFDGASQVTATTEFTVAGAVSETKTLTAKFEVDERLKIHFFADEDAYDNGDGTPFATVRLYDGQTFDAAEAELPTLDRDTEFLQFNKWVAVGDPSEVAVDEDSSFQTNTNIIGKWYKTSFTDYTGAEKVRLANGAFVVYEFDLATALSKTTVTVDDLADITGLTYQQKVNEATVETRSVRGMRVYGPYAYNANDIMVNQRTWGHGDVYHGDFKKTAEGLYVAKMNGGDQTYDVENMRTFNKFHSYMVYNNATRFGKGQGIGWADVESLTNSEFDGPLTADTWAGVTIPLNGTIPATDAKGTTLGQTLLRIKGAGTDVLPAGTNFNKVYFAIGPGTENPTDAVTYLFKDVKLQITGVASGVDGKVPEFDGNATTYEQVFVCYEDGNRYLNWRGAPDALITDVTPSGTDEVFDGPMDELHTALVDEGFFYLRLGDWQTPGSGQTANVGSFTGQHTKGPLTSTFADNTNRLNIGLTPYQTEILANSELKITVTFKATATATSDFHFYLGNGTAGAGWNVTDASTTAPIADLSEVDHELTSTGGAITHFIMRGRNGSPFASTDVTFDWVKVAYTYAPADPAVPATEDFVFFQSTVYGGTAAPIRVGPIAVSAEYPTLSDLNAVGPVVFPTGFDVRSYQHFTVRVKYYIEGENDDPPVEINPAYGQQWGQVNIGGKDHYNLGESNQGDDNCTINAPITKLLSVADPTSLALNFQGRGPNSRQNKTGKGADGTTDVTGDVVYFELHEIIFFKD